MSGGRVEKGKIRGEREDGWRTGGEQEEKVDDLPGTSWLYFDQLAWFQSQMSIATWWNLGTGGE